MTRAVGRAILAVSALLCLVANVSAQQTTSASQTKAFEVISVEGNQLVVRLPEGTREMTVPSDVRFTVDGKQMSVQELKPGMKGTATITTRTTVTPVTVTEVKNGTVIQASGSSITVRTADGFKMFSQGDLDKRGVKLTNDGKPIQLSDLRNGDRLTATIITSKPPRVVTEKEVQASLARADAPRSEPTPSARASAAPAAGPAPAASAPAAKVLPKTASPLPLVGLGGLASIVTAAVLAARRRRLTR